MEYSLTPKHKSDVQFNGDISHNKNWIVPYIRNIKNEFDQRYDEIKRNYDKLIDEVYWNNIIYNIELRFQPVIGNSYYLYNDNEIYTLSMIGPTEWKKEGFIGTFQFEYTGKWIKC